MSIAISRNLLHCIIGNVAVEKRRKPKDVKQTNRSSSLVDDGNDYEPYDICCMSNSVAKLLHTTKYSTALQVITWTVQKIR